MQISTETKILVGDYFPFVPSLDSGQSYLILIAGGRWQLSCGISRGARELAQTQRLSKKKNAYLMVHEYFICFTATWEEFIVHWETNKVFLIRVSSKRANLEKKLKQC